MLDSLSATFVTPLRQLLVEAGSHCRGQLHLKREETKTAKREGKPELSVIVGSDGQLPQPSLQDEIEVCVTVPVCVC
jgi:hypothetical protein